MASSKVKTTVYKFVSLLSVVRGYNIFVLVIAQYLAAIFIFSPKKSLKNVIFDVDFLFIVLASIFVVASGYIINNFYDVKIDRINRPVKFGLDNYTKQATKLKLYFVFNVLGFFFGFLISWRAALFFSVYIFLIWFYSHKLKRKPLIGIISAAVLTIFPFFVVFIYFKNFSTIIFAYAIFLFLTILVRELLKDLENIKGALATNYTTFSVAYGEHKTKQFCTLLLSLSLVPIVFLFTFPALNYMKYYFYFAVLVLFLVGFFLWKSKTRTAYIRLHTILKLLLFIGVLCLVFIDTSLIVEKVLDRLN